MPSYRTNALAAAATLVLAACAGAQDQTVETRRFAVMTAADTSFNQYLSEAYLALANAEIRADDWRDSDHFAEKALLAARNRPVAPDPVDVTRLDAGQVKELSTAREQIDAVLGQGARSAAPRHAASAQSSFDCWLRDAMGDGPPQSLAACRSAFYRALSRVQLALGVLVTPTPLPELAGLGNSYLVYFDSDSAKLSATALATIDAVAASLKASDSAKAVLVSHADPAGPDLNDAELAARRVEAVREILLSAGVHARQITESADGGTAARTSVSDEAAWDRRIEIKLFE